MALVLDLVLDLDKELEVVLEGSSRLRKALDTQASHLWCSPWHDVLRHDPR